MIGNRLVAAVALGALVAACAPPLQENTPVKEVRWLKQNWSAGERFWFHHATQGTSTLRIPYKWFVALEQPSFRLFGDPPLMKDSDFLWRFGFIPSPRSLESGDGTLRKYGYTQSDKEAYATRTFTYDEKKFAGNPDGLPVGFARLSGAKDPFTGKDLPDQIGFTCAACHTGHLEYNGVSLRIDGAPAVTDVGKFRDVIGLALAYTKYVPLRFGRFADRVLGEDHSSDDEAALKRKLEGKLALGKKVKEITDPVFEQNVEEGFARLDALNRIGNRVFFVDLLKPGGDNEDAIANVAPMTAPVNFPHIWDTSWFDWVQYNASIMQPMVRNAGEALGVAAKVNLIKPGPDLYRSTVEVGEIYELEKLLAGDNPLSGERGFKGLRAPTWPEDVLGEIDWDLALGKDGKPGGKQLYESYCQGCHLPPVNDPSGKFWNPTFWTTPNNAGESYLKLKQIPIDYIGTDPGQAGIIVNRKVKVPEYLGIDPKALCNGTPGDVVTETLFALALGAVVEKTADKWYEDNGIDPQTRDRMNGYRPNCLQAKMIYKARPLDGIWATAPFLHNGSVPNLYELLSPVAERSATFYLGSRLFDPKKVGYEPDPIDGGFELDTTEPGNSNKGHAFEDGARGNGVIGPELSPLERMQLVEYLKSLGLPPRP